MITYSQLMHDGKMSLISHLHDIRYILKTSARTTAKSLLSKPSKRRKPKKITFKDAAREALFNNMSPECRKLFM